ncbi:hypothetical protein PR048_025056 [Dryococelus australis]|uniref:Uncharacterized protein n=1 Tax=Dryococelus australis TaxID=614101 RepID=A0ABQ9GQE5_9NEOP|nr:hypothetical protein PR048_025056 [Dryococelus australis]
MACSEAFAWSYFRAPWKTDTRPEWPDREPNPGPLDYTSEDLPLRFLAWCVRFGRRLAARVDNLRVGWTRAAKVKKRKHLPPRFQLALLITHEIISWHPFLGAQAIPHAIIDPVSRYRVQSTTLPSTRRSHYRQRLNINCKPSCDLPIYPPPPGPQAWYKSGVQLLHYPASWRTRYRKFVSHLPPPGRPSPFPLIIALHFTVFKSVYGSSSDMPVWGYRRLAPEPEPPGHHLGQGSATPVTGISDSEPDRRPGSVTQGSGEQDLLYKFYALRFSLENRPLLRSCGAIVVKQLACHRESEFFHMRNVEDVDTVRRDFSVRSFSRRCFIFPFFTLNGANPTQLLQFRFPAGPPEFSRVGDVTSVAGGRRVFAWYSHLPCICILPLLHPRPTSPSPTTFNTSLLSAYQNISSKPFLPISFPLALRSIHVEYGQNKQQRPIRMPLSYLCFASTRHSGCGKLSTQLTLPSPGAPCSTYIHQPGIETQKSPSTVTYNFSEALLKFYVQDIPPPHVKPGSIPDGVAFGIFACGNRGGRCRYSAGVLSGISRFPSPFHSGAAPYSPRFTLIDVKSRPNLSTHPPIVGCSCASQVKKRGSDTGDTNTHAKCLIAPTRKACSRNLASRSSNTRDNDRRSQKFPLRFIRAPLDGVSVAGLLGKGGIGDKRVQLGVITWGPRLGAGVSPNCPDTIRELAFSRRHSRRNTPADLSVS